MIPKSHYVNGTIWNAADNTLSQIALKAEGMKSTND